LSRESYKTPGLPFRTNPSPQDGGLRVTNVNADAGFGDLKAGDLIVSLNGVSTAGATMYKNVGPMVALMEKLKVGDTVEVKVLRDKKELTFSGKAIETPRQGWHVTQGTGTALRKLWLSPTRG
jgi:C-terminal processing protease CtpA/Prc